jgi:hypothetical protein
VRGLLLLAALVTAGPALLAADLTPNDEKLAAAIARGEALAAAHGGYGVKDYIAWAVPDARNIDATLGNVDAVLIATPIERATHAGFVAGYNGRKLSVKELRRSPEVRPGWLRIIVFARGPDSNDETFIEKFADPRLVFADATIGASKTEHSDPSDATYPRANENRRRQVGTVTFQFDLSSFPTMQSAKGQLKFTDDAGKQFDVPIDLGIYP